jgi:hypothetical protein
MIGDAMTSRMQHGDRQHHQRKNREQMDRTPWTPQSKLVDEECGHAHDRHEHHPDPAGEPVTRRAFRQGNLHEAEDERGNGRCGVNLNDGTRLQQRGEIHGASLFRSAAKVMTARQRRA